MKRRAKNSGARAEAMGQDALPIQPVDRPIICGPYDEPTWYWLYDTSTGAASKTEGRRPASYWYKSQRTSAGQLSLLTEEESDPLPLVNALRDDVRRWRKSDYEGATSVSKQLLRYWARSDRARRLFFCQREAVETIVYLTEILGSGKRPRFVPKLTLDDFDRLRRGERVSFGGEAKVGLHASLADIPNEPGLAPLARYSCKMATGSGKTVVMAMIIAWSFCNRGRVPGDDRFASAALIVCPNLTINERLQVLRPESADNYYEQFDIVPSQLLPELRKGKVLVLNWHKFALESPHADGGRSYAVVNKGDESAGAFAQRVLGDLHDRGPLLVLNDEAHHAYRPAAVSDGETLSRDEKAEREEATIWIAGLDRINSTCGIRSCVDLSATPFYLHGSGYAEGTPFPWIVSDFGLVDAIESGIVKIPRLPVSDTSGRPEPKYFALWRWITWNLAAGEKLPGGKPKPDVVWRESQDALATLMSQWKERFEYAQDAAPGQEHVPPVLIIVCDNTDVAQLFYEKISGESTVDVADDGVDAGDDDDEKEPRARRKKPKTRTVFGRGALFPELFSNTAAARRTLRIDSKLLAEAETGDASNRQEAAERLREIVATVGKPGRPGEQVRCVVSVQMLTEGWDANNVTHVLGLRAFLSQLLCEQVVGRGLRRMDYTPDPVTGLLTEEYVDVYGVPFSVIPFKGRPGTTTTPEDKPKNHVRALPERADHELRFPVVESYVIDLKNNLVRADVSGVEPLVLEPDRNPTAVFVKPQVGHTIGSPNTVGGFRPELQDRTEFYESTHLQTIKFEIAREIVWRLTESVRGNTPKLKLRSRHQLFPQVFRIVDDYVSRRVSARGCDMRELGLETYSRRTVERLVDAIEPDDTQGEPPLLPVLNRSRPIGSTAGVSFKTTRPCVPTTRSHINQVVADTQSWEQAAVVRLEAATSVVISYARNDHLELVIPYEYQGTPHAYFPDFLVGLASGVSLLLEIKGEEDDRDRAKHQAARRWVSAVNHWGQLGHWAFHVCRDPQLLTQQLMELSNEG
jgi:type III restriction enzyme